jgi:hypothetical protein
VETITLEDIPAHVLLETIYGGSTHWDGYTITVTDDPDAQQGIIKIFNPDDVLLLDIKYEGVLNNIPNIVPDFIFYFDSIEIHPFAAEGIFRIIYQATLSNVNYTPILLPMIKKIWPQLLANSIVGVQPMTGSFGIVFPEETCYNPDYGNFT